MNPRKKHLRGLAIFLVLIFFAFPTAFGKTGLRILLTNDDGYDSPGLAALVSRLSSLGTVTVAASSRNRSGTSHGITTNAPIGVEKSEKDGVTWYVIDALPATCLRLALEALLPEKPDMVISGLNAGDNTGVITFYSATVACAREAAFVGVPAISAHLQKGEDMDYGAAADFVADLVGELQHKGFKPRVFLNINFPALPKERLKGVMLTRQDTRGSLEFYEKRVGPEGAVSYLPSYKHLEAGTEKTDVWALANGYISITPFQIDQTDYPELKRLKSLPITKRKN